MTSEPSDGRTLPWTLLRRQVRPYALANILDAVTAIVAPDTPE